MAENQKINETDDITHSWVYGLKKGDRVWMAQEESIAQTERFVVDFLDQVGPSEFESVEEIFVPYEMEVVNNWTLNNGDGETHIVALEFVEPRKYRQLRFVCQCDTRDLVNLFNQSHCSSQTTVPTRIFKTQHDCRKFCKFCILNHYTVEMCDTLIEELRKMIGRIHGVKDVCLRDEAANYSGDLF